MQNIITSNNNSTNNSNNNIYSGNTTTTTNPTPQPANANFCLHPNYTLGLNLAQSPEPPLRMDLTSTMHETTSNKNKENIGNTEKTKAKDKHKIANAMTIESIQSQHTRKMYPSDYSTTMTYDMANDMQNYNTDNNFGLYHNVSTGNFRDNRSAFNDVLNIYNLESYDHGEPCNQLYNRDERENRLKHIDTSGLPNLNSNNRNANVEIINASMTHSHVPLSKMNHINAPSLAVSKYLKPIIQDYIETFIMTWINYYLKNYEIIYMSKNNNNSGSDEKFNINQLQHKNHNDVSISEDLSNVSKVDLHRMNRLDVEKNMGDENRGTHMQMQNESKTSVDEDICELDEPNFDQYRILVPLCGASMDLIFISKTIQTCFMQVLEEQRRLYDEASFPTPNMANSKNSKNSNTIDDSGPIEEEEEEKEKEKEISYCDDKC